MLDAYKIIANESPYTGTVSAVLAKNVKYAITDNSSIVAYWNGSRWTQISDGADLVTDNNYNFILKSSLPKAGNVLWYY